MFLIIPEKNATKKHIIIAKIIAIVAILGIIALAVWGAILIADYENLLGIIPIAVAVLLSLAQIIAGIVLYGRNH